jgi:hypothetical protein
MTIKKGTARAITNIKPMAGGAAIAQLQIGDYVFGEQGPTDLINFTHFYRAGGERVELLVGGVSALCKAFIGTNLTLSDEPEAVPPVMTAYPERFQIRFPDGLGGWQPYQGYKKE